MSVRPTPKTFRRRDAGHTLVEVIVASTLFVAFIVGLYDASAVFFSLIDVQSDRTDMLLEMNVTRSSIISDARGVSSVACAGSDVLELTTDSGGPTTVVEYKSDGEHLVRWDSGENKNYYVADHVASVECASLGGSDGVTVKMIFGEDPDVFALHVDLLDL
jgi:hypothetical protein